MNYQVLLSSSLVDAVFKGSGSSLKDCLDNCFFNIYAGDVPTLAELNGGFSGRTLIAQICKGDAALTNDLVWDDTTSPGTLMKPSGDTWSAPTDDNVLATGQPTFFVINVDTADDNSAAATATQYRVLGLIGADDTYAIKLGMQTAGDALELGSFSLFVIQ